jgi:hypothetical protein
VVSMALVIAIGVAESGELEVLGFGVAPSEDVPFWKAFPGSLVDRDLKLSEEHRLRQRGQAGRNARGERPPGTWNHSSPIDGGGNAMRVPAPPRASRTTQPQERASAPRNPC